MRPEPDKGGYRGSDAEMKDACTRLVTNKTFGTFLSSKIALVFQARSSVKPRWRYYEDQGQKLTQPLPLIVRTKLLWAYKGRTRPVGFSSVSPWLRVSG
ncbi:hypothetical protein O3P69_018586 [Scylla paramamosain]|uniref:Uncharacterized protein n=1 Tax=Scylla paramamosain TaxID=85552 RepID=A0AAW0T210_SCYPA